MSPYRLVDHIADIAVDIWGKDEQDFFNASIKPSMHDSISLLMKLISLDGNYSKNLGENKCVRREFHGNPYWIMQS